jgi:hypothetical protein
MGFHLGLAQRELDVAGEKLTIEYRLGKDDPDRMPQLAMRSFRVRRRAVLLLGTRRNR